MILEKYQTPALSENKNILYLYKQTNISIKEQCIINDIIKLFDIDNEILVYTYMIKNNIEYIIYKSKKQPTEFEINRTGVNRDEMIYTDIIYDSKNKTIRIDISIRNDELNKLVLFNSKDFNINEINITSVLKYYNNTLEALLRTRNYNPVKE